MTTMPSEKRLHPASFVFRLGSQLKALVVPLGFVLLGAGSGDAQWQLWALLISAPYGILALAQSLAVRYRFDDRELVIRTGLIFRNVRHIPYARIQNIDAVQNILHRLLHVAEVRIETGGGSEVEAKMQVLPLAAFEEMRTHVFAQAQPAVPVAGTEERTSPQESARREDVLLRLPVSELVLNGLIQNRGAIVVGAMFGLAVELGMMDRLMDRVFGDTDSDRGVLRQLLRSLAGQAVPPVGQLLMALGVLTLLLVALRVLSVVWTLTRLYGFTLTRIGEDLRTEFGLFTRVKATIPLRRIQTLTIHENPLHRLCGRVSIAVDTAGAAPEDADGSFGGESIAPILRSGDVPAFLREILPGIDIGAVDWQAPHPRAFRRMFVKGLIWALLLSAAFVLMLKWWTLVLFVVTGAWVFWYARLSVRHLRWGMAGDAVLLRRGWLWRRMSLARVTKVQVVAMHESPFDRRHGMASVAVDTAGGGSDSNRVDIPYLGRQVAEGLAETLTAGAARTAFRW
jgi:putative membrane protein